MSLAAKLSASEAADTRASWRMTVSCPDAFQGAEGRGWRVEGTSALVTPIVCTRQNDVRLLTIPATLIGIAIAIIFFKVYGIFTRPDVPRPVAIVVDQFAPGVSICAKVADVRHSVAAMTYVPHLGYVGIPGSRGTNLPNGYNVKFAQVRLLLDEETRRLPSPNPAKTRIDAVEIVSGEANAASDI